MPNKYIADPKVDRLEISGPGLRFVVIYMRTVQTQTGTRISSLGPATETKSDQSEPIVRPVPCKRTKKNVWRSIRTRAGLSSFRSHINTPSLRNWFGFGPIATLSDWFRAKHLFGVLIGSFDFLHLQ